MPFSTRRSIVADTALRQENQASGRGRLDPGQMRSFVQAIAWEMYHSGREALDVTEDLPILRKILPDVNDADLAELAEVTIVNQPELTKGEETGFEFVHKSFSEYFAAERIATDIERVCFQTEQWGSKEKAWQMSPPEATRQLASLFAARLLTAQVQEMLEPMLGDFEVFLKEETDLSAAPDAAVLTERLERKLIRFEGLAEEFAGGTLLDAVAAEAQGSRAVNPLEAYGNYASGLLFVARALVRRVERLDKLPIDRFVKLSPSALLRLIHIVLGGDIQIDTTYANRGLGAIDIRDGSKEALELFFPPLPPAYLRGVRGFNIPLSTAITSLEAEIAGMQIENILFSLLSQYSGRGRPGQRAMHYEYRIHYDRGMSDYLRRIVDLESGDVSREDARYRLERQLFEFTNMLRESGDLVTSPRMLEEAVFRIRDLAQRQSVDSLPYPLMYERAEQIIRHIFEKPQRKREPMRPTS